MITTKLPGEGDEREYHVLVFVDGQLYWSAKVGARTSEAAVAIAYCQAVVQILSLLPAPAPAGPEDPPAAPLPGQTSYLT